jgi:hypothetical protein
VTLTVDPACSDRERQARWVSGRRKVVGRVAIVWDTSGTVKGPTPDAPDGANITNATKASAVMDASRRFMGVTF